VTPRGERSNGWWPVDRAPVRAVLSDEIYDRILYDDSRARLAAQLPGDPHRGDPAQGGSKTYAMTGWRRAVDLAAALIDRLRKLAGERRQLRERADQYAAIAALRAAGLGEPRWLRVRRRPSVRWSAQRRTGVYVCCRPGVLHFPTSSGHRLVAKPLASAPCSSGPGVALIEDRTRRAGGGVFCGSPMKTRTENIRREAGAGRGLGRNTAPAPTEPVGRLSGWLRSCEPDGGEVGAISAARPE